MNNHFPIPIFIGYDYRERAAANVLIDSLYQLSSRPLAIVPLLTPQLIKQGLYYRVRDPKQSTDFSFTRFLVPRLMNYSGWAIFMDCDMLCRTDINKLWDQCDDKYSLMCVKHEHKPKKTKKFQGEIQTTYPKKNWSSLMLINCKRCQNLSVEYVNSASGLDLHRFNWLESDQQIGEIKGDWNFLIDEQIDNQISKNAELIHWTLGGPWFKDQRLMGGELAAEWFAARDEIIKLWD